MSSAAYYETDKNLSEYLEFHFGPDKVFGIENFMETVIKNCIDLVPESSRRKALDIGCAVGRGSYEFAKYGFQEVHGIDYSENFIRSAQKVQKKGRVSYSIKSEGKIMTERDIKLEDMGFDADVIKKVKFDTGDAHDLPETLTDFDLILAANLIDRLSNPRMFLKSIVSRIKIGGFLVITSPYTWLEEYTPEPQWIGGYISSDGIPRSSLKGLMKELETKGGMEFVRGPLDVTFVIRETARKYQHTVAQMTCWKRIK